MKPPDSNITRNLLLFLPLALVAVLLVLIGDAVQAASGPGIPHQITTSVGDGTRISQNPSVSGGGRWIVFRSDADFLGQGIPDNQHEMWLVDTSTLSYTRITTASAPDRTTYDSDISTNGRAIAFRTDSDLFNQGIPKQQYEVWLYDIPTMTHRRVTTAATPDRKSVEPSLSANGRYVAFHGDADLLNQGLPNNQREVWIYDAVDMTYTRVTSNTRESRRASISADGLFVAFESSADFFGEGIPNGQEEIWLYDTVNLTYTRVTTASDGERDSRRPSLNWDGSLVAFESDSDILGQGIPDDQNEIWLYNTVTRVYTRVTTAMGPGDRQSGYANISDDGKVVAFESDSYFFGTGNAEAHEEIWTYRTDSGILARLTNTYSDTYNSHPSASANGDHIAFASSALFWEPGQGTTEIWMNYSDQTVWLPLVLKAP